MPAEIFQDPVCKGWIKRREAKFSYTAKEATYHFCSVKCLGEFMRNHSKFDHTQEVLQKAGVHDHSDK